MKALSGNKICSAAFFQFVKKTKTSAASLGNNAWELLRAIFYLLFLSLLSCMCSGEESEHIYNVTLLLTHGLPKLIVLSGMLVYIKVTSVCEYTRTKDRILRLFYDN